MNTYEEFDDDTETPWSTDSPDYHEEEKEEKEEKPYRYSSEYIIEEKEIGWGD